MEAMSKTTNGPIMDISNNSTDLNKTILMRTCEFNDSSLISNLELDENCQDEIRTQLLIQFHRLYPIQQWKTYGFFQEEFLILINTHWLKNYPLLPCVHYFWAFIYTIVMSVGCIGNGIVILLFMRSPLLRTPANYLILNLAVSDFCMLAKLPIFIYNSIMQGPALGSAGCTIYGFVGGLTGTGSVMTLTMISLDRSAVILHSSNPNWKTTKIRALGMISIVWMYSGFFSSLPLFGINNYVPEGYLTSCSFDYLSQDFHSRLFVFIFFIAAWFIPLSIISFSYTSIFLFVSKAGSSSFFQQSTRRRSGSQTRELKIAIIGTIIVTIWILAWTPYALVALLGIFGKQDLISSFVSEMPALFCKSSSCINPFVYVFNHPKFQIELTKICSRCKCLMDSNNTTTSNDISLRRITSSPKQFGSITTTGTRTPQWSPISRTGSTASRTKTILRRYPNEKENWNRFNPQNTQETEV